MRQGILAGGLLALRIAFITSFTLAAPAMARDQETAAPWRSTTSGSVNETCDDFFFVGTLNTDVGVTFSTWVAIADLDPHAAIARLKQAAAVENLELGLEDYRGAQGSLTVFRRDTPEARGFPIHIDADGTLGTVNLYTRTERGQSEDMYGMKRLMCSLIARAAGSPLPVEKKRASQGGWFSNTFKSDAKRKQEADSALETTRRRYFGALDALYKRALAAGKAIVIIPSINLDAKYQGSDLAAKHAAFWADQTSTTIWQATGDPRDLFKVGYDAMIGKVGLHGYGFHFAAGRAFYLAYIVNPGTYTITGNTVEVERATLPEAGEARPSAKPGLGQISLVPTKNTEYYQTQEWFNAVYADRTIKNDYCTLTVVGGPCVQWYTDTNTVRDQVAPAGYRTVTNAKQVDGVVAAAKLTREFASFKVAPGDAVMVDGFFALYPNVGFDEGTCTSHGGSVQCDMREYALVRIPASLEHLKDPNAQAALEYLPGLAEILNGVKLREVDVAAKAGGAVDELGRDYVLKRP
jgi:hypothetical protein